MSQSPCHGGGRPDRENRWKTTCFDTGACVSIQIASRADHTDLYGLRPLQSLDKIQTRVPMNWRWNWVSRNIDFATCGRNNAASSHDPVFAAADIHRKVALVEQTPISKT